MGFEQEKFTDESRFTLECDTCDMFRYEEKKTLEITLHLFFKNHIADKVVWWKRAAVDIDGQMEPYIIQKGNLTGQEYAD